MLTVATSCNDWLDVKPNNEQITAEFWKSKEDVEAVISSGYYYLQQCVPGQIIKWGELRGGTFSSNNGNDAKLYTFYLLPSNSLCNYGSVYRVINSANSVLKYAPGVCDIDNTYTTSMMNSNLCEAYFLRAYCNLLLLKAYKEFPLVLEPYVDDTAPFDIAKSTSDVIIRQIKQDITDALATNAARGNYDEDWATKGRATKWALYALMADISLWNEDYADCKTYCDLILNANDPFRPVFMSIPSQWYDMFCFGNSNESIFELQWDYNTTGKTNNFNSLWNKTLTSATLVFTKNCVEKIKSEVDEAIANGADINSGRVGRMLCASVFPSTLNNSTYSANGTDFGLWKYLGNELEDYTGRQRADNNFILYRVAEIILMKAQAECMTGNIPDAVRLVNRIRNRALLPNFEGIDETDDAALSSLSELTVLREILHQKQMEFMGEGKRWFDLVWFGSISNHKYMEEFINEVITCNDTSRATESWIRSVLIDPNSWYLALPYSDIEHNTLLVQNPYYSASK